MDLKDSAMAKELVHSRTHSEERCMLNPMEAMHMCGDLNYNVFAGCSCSNSCGSSNYNTVYINNRMSSSIAWHTLHVPCF